jgi:hypothetical protein
VIAALRDLDWIEGFRRGIVDGHRAARGEQQVGPGVTSDPYDGWTPSPQRIEAYKAGLRRTGSA